MDKQHTIEPSIEIEFLGLRITESALSSWPVWCFIAVMVGAVMTALYWKYVYHPKKLKKIEAEKAKKPRKRKKK